MTVTRKVLNSAILSASAKVISKVLGLVSTMLLARILAPEEFGYIAIVSIALYFFDILSHAASEQYVIQKKKITRVELYTAWSANLVLKLLISLVICVSAPWVALFFDRPELTNAFRISSLILPIQALKSPIYLLLKRQLNFIPLFWSSLIERALAVPLVIALAFVLQSFWAFIITDIVASLLAVFISYFIARKPPTFTLSRVNEQWNFSKWMLGKSVVGYMRSQSDTVVVSKFFSGGALGNYHMARELAMMPAHFLLGPAIEPLLSAFKNDKESIHELHNNVAFSLVSVIVIAIPLCFFVWQWAAEVVLLLLGSDWEMAAELLPILILLFLYWTVMQVGETALLAQGKVKLLFLIDCLTLIVVVVGLLIIASKTSDLLALAWARAGFGILFCIVVLCLAFKGNQRQLLQVFFYCIAMTLVSSIWLFSVKSMVEVLDLADMNFILSIVIMLFSLVMLIFATVCVVFIGAKGFKNYHARRIEMIVGSSLGNFFKINRR